MNSFVPNQIEKEQLARRLAVIAQEALLYEATLSPKPGLVDAVDPGAHKDMDIYTFLTSAASLFPGFYEFALAGLAHEGDLPQLFSRIRPIGMKAEEDMFAATRGVNTHKGIIFSLGIALAATGYYLDRTPAAAEKNVLTAQEVMGIFAGMKTMTAGLVSQDFRDLHLKDTLTNGEKLYLKYGFTGIRGEAEAGFPIVTGEALPFLRERKDRSNDKNSLLLELLFRIMSRAEDSNIVNRGGIASLQYVQKNAADFLAAGGMAQTDALKKIQRLNEAFVAQNISPGGSADLLSLTVYFAKLENLI